jgi:putative hydrolase of the HAD superfamily
VKCYSSGAVAIRAVLFDLDDTLVDTTGTHPDRAERIAQFLTVHLPHFDPRSFVERALTKDQETGWRLGVAPLLAELGLQGTDLGTEALELWFFQGCTDLVRSFPGAQEAVYELQLNHALGVITNGRESRQRGKLEGLGFGRYFKVFVTSERAGAEKPAPEIFHYALGELGLAANEVAFVGDRLDTDVFGAKQAGMHTIWLDHQGRYPAGVGPDPDARIWDFTQLAKAVSEINTRILIEGEAAERV